MSVPSSVNGGAPREFPGLPILDDPPRSLPLQPKPVLTRVVYFRFLGYVITAVMRHWRPGDSGTDGRCKLCPKCKAYADGCLMVFGRRISRDEADLVSSIESKRLPKWFGRRGGDQNGEG